MPAATHSRYRVSSWPNSARHGLPGEHPRRSRCARDRGVARPGPVDRVANDAGTYRVQRDVSEALHQVVAGMHRLRVVAGPEQMAARVFAQVETRGEDGVERMHSAGQCRLEQPKQHVVVGGHQRVAEELPAGDLGRPVERREECDPVGIIRDDVGLPGAARRDVVDGARRLIAGRSWHVPSVRPAWPTEPRPGVPTSSRFALMEQGGLARLFRAAAPRLPLIDARCGDGAEDRGRPGDGPSAIAIHRRRGQRGAEAAGDDRCRASAIPTRTRSESRTRPCRSSTRTSTARPAIGRRARLLPVARHGRRDAPRGHPAVHASSRGGPCASSTCSGITLQAELTYSNVLEVLDLAGIPLRAADRGEGDPIVHGGRPVRLQPGAARAVRRRVLHGRGRGGLRRGASTSIEAGARAGPPAWPALRRAPVPVRAGARSPPRRARGLRRVRHRRRSRPGPVVPYSSRDLLARVASRSCAAAPAAAASATRAPGTGPVRERPADDVVEAGLEQLGCTGYDELSLTSLATSDYTRRRAGHRARSSSAAAVAAPLAAIQPRRHGPGGAERRGQRAPELDHARAGGGHAADARHHLQDDHRRDDRAARSRRRSQAGYTSLKLYFMIGLPRETYAEVQGIVDLGIRAREIGRREVAGAAASPCTCASPTSCPSRTRPSSGRACRGRSSCASSRSTCAGRCQRPAAAAVAARPPHLDARGRARPRRRGDGRRDRDGVARRSALRRLDRAPSGGTPGRRRFAAHGASIDGGGDAERAELGPAAVGSRAQRASRRSSCSTSGGQSRAERATGDCRWDGCTRLRGLHGPRPKQAGALIATSTPT